jgi:thioredoxin 1
VEGPAINGEGTAYSAADYGAFYGDRELGDFLFARLRDRASSGRVVARRFPYWSDGRGSVSAAMVGHHSPAVFEQMTGLPYSFACAMEFVGLEDPVGIGRLGSAIQPGADLSNVALGLIRDWLADRLNEWPSVLLDNDADRLRMDWLEITARRLAGEIIEPELWTSLRERSFGLKSAAPFRCAVDTVASLLVALTPPPEAESSGAWVMPLLTHGVTTRFLIVQTQQGWTREEMGQERVLTQWFRTREQLQPGGRFTPEARDLARAEWNARPKPPGYEQKLQKFHETLAVSVAPMLARLQDNLVKLVETAPQARGR